MDKKVTITLKRADKILIDEIAAKLGKPPLLDSQVLPVAVVLPNVASGKEWDSEQVLLWSLKAASLLFKISDQIEALQEHKSETLDFPFPLKSIFDEGGIEPDVSPTPMDDPPKIPKDLTDLDPR